MGRAPNRVDSPVVAADARALRPAGRPVPVGQSGGRPGRDRAGNTLRNGRTIGCIIPAHDEVGAIGHVVAAIPGWADVVIVVDNDSADGTGAAAAAAGARVVREEQRGYGAACLAGIAALPPAVDVVVFLDGDNSDHPEDMADLVDPIVRGEAELVIGSRARGAVEPGALTPQQRFGNWLATSLIRLVWGAPFSDLGPFRAIDRGALDRLAMRDRAYGWTVEMQVKAARAGMRVCEVPVRYRRRIGTSKISGTLRGTVLAGVTILGVIAREAMTRQAR